MKLVQKLIMILFIFNTAHAQNSRESLVLEHLKLTGIQSEFENIEEYFISATKKQVEDISSKELFVLNEQGLGAIDSIRNKYVSLISKLGAKHFSWQSVKNEFISIYLETYTDQELIEINKFFSSHYGKRYLEQLKHIEKKLPEIALNRQLAMEPEMNSLIENMNTELKSVITNQQYQYTQ